MPSRRTLWVANDRSPITRKEQAAAEAAGLAKTKSRLVPEVALGAKQVGRPAALPQRLTCAPRSAQVSVADEPLHVAYVLRFGVEVAAYERACVALGIKFANDGSDERVCALSRAGVPMSPVHP